ncbi:MAG: prepilin-type N-terminal cleavage/methylation domain-containing protein [Planctomycetes bacterium]|nr:prepilin-type N-terminal cleavage/methylation domain-containing protein [Planctomycetota bacterium]
MDRTRRQTNGFTLIEVLVVVAIIALLISILLPSLSAARDETKNTACKARLNQVGLAMRYCFDTYKAYPLWDDGNVSQHMRDSGWVMATWIDVLYANRFLKELTVGDCPKDLKPDNLMISRGAEWGFKHPSGEWGVDYSYGISVPCASWGWKVSGSGFRIDRYQSSIVLAADGWWDWLHGFGVPGLPKRLATYMYWGGTTVGYRHGSGRMPSANVLFLDNNVRSVRLNLGDYYPNDKNQLRGLRTSDKFFWRSGEHTLIGWASNANTLDINGNPYPTTNNNYPEGSGSVMDSYPDQLDPGWWSQHDKTTGLCRWPGAVKIRKGWRK